MADGENGDERGERLGEGNLNGVAVHCPEAFHPAHLALAELARATDQGEVLRAARPELRIQEAGEGIDHVLRCELPSVMKAHPLAEVEGPDETVA